MTRAEHFALDMLKDAQQGMTEALAAANGIERRTLDRLVAAGKARMTNDVLAKPAITVPRFHFVKR